MATIGYDPHKMGIELVNSIRPGDLVTNPLKQNTNKILFIDSEEHFDMFTNIYGYINSNNYLGIKWSTVAKDFKGFGLSSCFGDNNFTKTYFYGKQYVSWWDQEYYYNDFILFVPIVQVGLAVSIASPSVNIDSKVFPEKNEWPLGNESDKKFINDESDEKIITEESEISNSGSSSSDEEESEDSSSSSSESESEESENDIGKKSGQRYFKLINSKTGKAYGRYSGDTPKQAASKGFTKLVQQMRSNGENMTGATIFLQESTRGCNGKTYAYKASRVKLPHPQELRIRDPATGAEKIITYNYRNKIVKTEIPNSTNI